MEVVMMLMRTDPFRDLDRDARRTGAGHHLEAELE
jgi:hypothetical protein